MLKFTKDTGAYDYNWYTYTTRFVCITITEDKTKSEFECSIHPNIDKGYRDPYELKSFNRLSDAVKFATEYMEKEE